jgi:chemotaxis protein MotB
VGRARLRSQRGPDVWPGYVDALTTLLLAITFLLTVYVLAQFFLSHALSGREKALERLSQEVAALSRQLAGERTAKQRLQTEAAHLTTALESSSAARETSDKRAAALEGDVNQLNAQVAELRAQLGQIAAALGASEAKSREQQVVITDLGQRLQVALAEKVAEMARYRSEFFGRLREVLGDRADVRVVGDRFVFQAEVLFPSGSADLSPEGRATLSAFARTLMEIAGKIPEDVSWVLRVDGHTDRVPISPALSARFPSNWELSAARALSVVKFLVSRGVPSKRLAATGFGEFQPLDDGKDAASNARNRRIEMRLTDR